MDVDPLYFEICAHHKAHVGQLESDNFLKDQLKAATSTPEYKVYRNGDLFGWKMLSELTKAQKNALEYFKIVPMEIRDPENSPLSECDCGCNPSKNEMSLDQVSSEGSPLKPPVKKKKSKTTSIPSIDSPSFETIELFLSQEPPSTEKKYSEVRPSALGSSPVRPNYSPIHSNDDMSVEEILDDDYDTESPPPTPTKSDRNWMK